MGKIFTVLFLCFFQLCNAQIVVSGNVLSDEKSPIQDVQILTEEGLFLSKTDAKGYFELEISQSQTIVFSHILYKDYSLDLNDISGSLEIYLSLKENQIPEVFISAKLPEIVYSDENYHVADYEFSSNGIYLLTYTKKKLFKKQSDANTELLSECQVILLDEELKVKSKSVFFQDGISLHLDSYGQLFLKCVSNVYFLYEELDGILSTEMNKAEFESSIEPLVIGDEEVKIYSSFDPTFPEFNYYLQNGSDQNVKDIYTITDSVLMHTFRAQYRDLSPRSKLEAYRSELETGIDKEIISGYMAGFHNSIYFKPPYAPIFKLDSGYLVVDIPSSKMVFLNKEGEVLNAIKVSFHEQSKAKGWKNLMVQDGITNSVYVVYEKNGIVTLNLLDLKSAAPSSSSKLTYKYPEKIKIKDGYIYYLYRPFESSQKHYLYKEKLKNSL